MSLIHELALHSNKQFLYFILDLIKNPDVKDSIKTSLLTSSNISIEINTVHSMSGHTPFTTLVSNGLYEDIQNLVTRAKNKEFKLDISRRDDRGRNILHMALLNNFLGQSIDERLKIIKLFIANFKQPAHYIDKGFVFTELFKQFDMDGFIPLTTLITQIRANRQDEATEKALLEIFMDHSKNYEKEELPNDYVSPVVICI
jgi:hypothetical protein